MEDTFVDGNASLRRRFLRGRGRKALRRRRKKDISRQNRQDRDSRKKLQEIASGQLMRILRRLPNHERKSCAEDESPKGKTGVAAARKRNSPPLKENT